MLRNQLNLVSRLQKEREEALDDFKYGKLTILILGTSDDNKKPTAMVDEDGQPDLFLFAVPCKIILVNSE